MRRKRSGAGLVPAAGLLFVAGAASAQGTGQGDDLTQRVERLEMENAELQRRFDSVVDELFRLDVGTDLVPPVGDSVFGLGPAASKVYGKESGLSIGGYGEAVYSEVAGPGDEFDFVRMVLYFGYKFSENWVLNTEVEIEHADEIFLEFAMLDYLCRDELNARAGLLLVPMGFLNELHEPTTFLSAKRPITERMLIPSTWRENGAGVFGDVGPISYRAYVVNGLDGSGFTSGGLRGGRQKGSQALADDLAVVGRADWTDTPGLLVGGSVYHGGSGQEQAGLGDTTTTIWEAHGEWKWRGVWLRGLYAGAMVDDVAELNADQGFTGAQSVGEELEGGYVEAAYDVMQQLDPDSGAAVRPFVRYEMLDTQADVPSGFASADATDEEVVTFGVQVQPIPQLVFKVDFRDFEEGTDDLNASLGYVF